MFTEDDRAYLRRRHTEAAGEVAAETHRVELRAQADHALPGQAGTLYREVGEHIDGVAHHNEVSVLLQARRLDLIEQREEEIDVTIDEIEPALIGLTAQAGGDDDHIAACDFTHIARADANVRGQTHAVQQLGGVAESRVLVGIDEAKAADRAAALKRVSGTAADQSAAADNADFHR